MAELLRRLRRGTAQHHRLRRHRHRQDDPAQRAVLLHPRGRTDRHDRGRGRAAAPAGPRRPAGEPPAEHRGQGRDHHPRPGPQLAAHAARPHRGRRGPRRRVPGHAAGDEHRPRRLAVDRARQLAARRDRPAGDPGADGRHGPAAARDPGADRLSRRRHRPAHPAAGRHPAGHATSPRSRAWRARPSRCRTRSSSTIAAGVDAQRTVPAASRSRPASGRASPTGSIELGITLSRAASSRAADRDEPSDDDHPGAHGRRRMRAWRWCSSP